MGTVDPVNQESISNKDSEKALAALQAELISRRPRPDDEDENRDIIGRPTMKYLDPTASPWRSVAYIEAVKHNDKVSRGTAFFVSDRILVTAAHCLVDENGSPRYIYVYPGLTASGSTSDPPGPGSAQAYKIPQGWLDTNGGQMWDYGLILMPEGTSAPEQKFALAALNDDDLGGAPAVVAGYPDLSTHLGVPQFTLMVGSSGHLGQPQDTALPHIIDSENGQSGGPTCLLHGAAVGPVVGIHTTGTPGFNGASRLTEAVVGNLKAWASDWNASF
jgi:V8-like Glu-specific endopeptidase